MNEPFAYCRSPQLMNPGESLLLIVDIQQKLLPAIANNAAVEQNAGKAIDAARLFEIPCLVTEQYPNGLGRTTEHLRSRLTGSNVHFMEKVTFSAMESDDFRARLVAAARHKVLVCGLESHICVQQTVLDLIAEGMHVFVAADAIGSRSANDHEIALRRMESEGATLTTVEAAIFEWCQTSKHPAFKALQQLIKD